MFRGEGKRFDLLDTMGWKRPDPSAARRFVAIAGNLLAVLVVVIILFLLAHFLYLLTDFDRDENIRDIALALAGVIGFPVIVWRAVVHARQADIAQENLTTDLINKAVEGLGAEKTVKRDGAEGTEPNLEVRIGAIYQLERIARTQAHSGTPQGAEDHIRIMKILCAYVRENSNARTPSEHGLMPWPDYPKKATTDQVKVRERWYRIRASALDRWARSLPKPRLDIQTAMEVLGGRDATQQDIEQADKRPGQDDGYRLDLRGANLQAAALAHLDFSRADISRARMEGADLSGAKMEGANLFRAKFKSANWAGSINDGSPAQFADIRGGVDLDQSRLSSLIGNAATLLPETPDGEPDLFVPSCWLEEPPGFEQLLAASTSGLLAPSEEELRDPDFGWFCAPGAVPMKTGTPWPVDQPPPWEQAGMEVEDWLKLPENRPTEPVDPGG